MKGLLSPPARKSHEKGQWKSEKTYNIQGKEQLRGILRKHYGVKGKSNDTIHE